MIGRCTLPVRLKILCLVLLLCIFTKAQRQIRPINSGRLISRWRTSRPVISVHARTPANMAATFGSRLTNRQQSSLIAQQIRERRRQQRNVFIQTQQPNISRQRLLARAIINGQLGNPRSFRPRQIQRLARRRQTRIPRNGGQAMVPTARRLSNNNRNILMTQLRTRQTAVRPRHISGLSNRPTASVHLSMQHGQSVTGRNQHRHATHHPFRISRQLVSRTNIGQPVNINQQPVELNNNVQQRIDTPNTNPQFVDQANAIQEGISSNIIIEQVANDANNLQLQPVVDITVQNSPINRILTMLQQNSNPTSFGQDVPFPGQPDVGQQARLSSAELMSFIGLLRRPRVPSGDLLNNGLGRILAPGLQSTFQSGLLGPWGMPFGFRDSDMLQEMMFGDTTDPPDPSERVTTKKPATTAASVLSNTISEHGNSFVLRPIRLSNGTYIFVAVKQSINNMQTGLLDSIGAALDVPINDVSLTNVAKSVPSSQIMSPLFETQPIVKTEKALTRAILVTGLDKQVQPENINIPIQTKLVDLPHRFGDAAVNIAGTANTHLQSIITNSVEAGVVQENIKPTLNTRLHQFPQTSIEIPNHNFFEQMSNSPSVVIKKSPNSEHKTGSPTNIRGLSFLGETRSEVDRNVLSSSAETISAQAPSKQVLSETKKLPPEIMQTSPITLKHVTTTETTLSTTEKTTTTTEESEFEQEDMTTTASTNDKQITTQINNFCSPLSTDFNCVGKDLFVSLNTVVPWCLGMCIKNKCVDAVCECGCSNGIHRKSTWSDPKPTTTVEPPEIEDA